MRHQGDGDSDRHRVAPGRTRQFTQPRPARGDESGIGIGAENPSVAVADNRLQDLIGETAKPDRRTAWLGWLGRKPGILQSVETTAIVDHRVAPERLYHLDCFARFGEALFPALEGNAMAEIFRFVPPGARPED